MSDHACNLVAAVVLTSGGWLAAGIQPKGHENDAWALGWTFHAAATGLNFFSYNEDQDVYAQAVAGDDLRGNIACALSEFLALASALRIGFCSNLLCILFANHVTPIQDPCTMYVFMHVLPIAKPLAGSFKQHADGWCDACRDAAGCLSPG